MKDEDFEFAETGEITGDREQMYKKLKEELIQQIRVFMIKVALVKEIHFC